MQVPNQFTHARDDEDPIDRSDGETENDVRPDERGQVAEDDFLHGRLLAFERPAREISRVVQASRVYFNARAALERHAITQDSLKERAALAGGPVGSSNRPT